MERRIFTTDIYVIATYYQSDELVWQAHAVLAMLTTNLVFQIGLVLTFYQKKSWGAKLKEALITLLFIRPAVDAYRVSTNHEDSETATDSLIEMIINKCCELGCESIPGCVLQVSH